MNQIIKRYNADKFLEHLRDETLTRPLAFVGMAKLSEKKTSILLDTELRCQNWIEIPVKFIAEEGIEWLGHIPCQGHEHPLVQIELKPAYDEEAQLWQKMAASRTSQPALGMTDSIAFSTKSSLDRALGALLELQTGGAGVLPPDMQPPRPSTTALARVPSWKSDWKFSCTDCITEHGHPNRGQIVCCYCRINTDIGFPWLECERCSYTICMGHTSPGMRFFR